MWCPRAVVSYRQWGCIVFAVGLPENHPECLLELLSWKDRMLELTPLDPFSID